MNMRRYYEQKFAGYPDVVDVPTFLELLRERVAQ